MTKLDEDLKAISDSLDYPANFRADSVRIINELRGQYEYRRTSELPNLINSLNPPEAVPAP